MLETTEVQTPNDDDTLTQTGQQADHARELSRQLERAPATISGYVVSRCLGEGAYGSVWLAEEQNTGKIVAIKFYTHRRGLDWSLLSREVEKLAVLYTSRNIVGLLDVGWDSDPPYYVMEYLENGSLASFLEQGPLPAHEAVRIAKSVLMALVHAHGSGILHCDLKPANVLLDADFEPRICDFGQSRLPHERIPALGTLFYMAPEQAALDAVPDARWDVYALGALLYHMLSGVPPYRTPENERTVQEPQTLIQRLESYRHLLANSPKPPSLRRLPGVDRRLADIIDRCLRVDPQKRYPNAQAVLDELELRDRQRARRPLLTLGIIGPVLLLGATSPIIYNAMIDVLQSARLNLTERALESNVLPARILARSLERELADRKAELLEIAKDPAIKEAIEASTHQSWPQREALFLGLESRKRQVDRRRDEMGLSQETSWFVNDRQGFQIWRDPPNEKTDLQNYAHRDYFGGNDTEFSRLSLPAELDKLEQPEYQPIREPHISLAFRSDATLRYMVAITVPVWDDAEQRVIGVLARTTDLGQLLQEYAKPIQGRPDGKRGHDVSGKVNRIIALVDQRDWKLLDHPWMTPENLQKLGAKQNGQNNIFPGKKIKRQHASKIPPAKSSDPFSVLSLSGRLVEKLSRLQTNGRTTADSTGSRPTGLEQDDRDAAYRDPVGLIDPEKYGDVWLAAFSPVGETGWLTIVQERRQRTLTPIEDMRRGLIRSGLNAILVILVLIIMLLYFVRRGLNDRSLRIWTAPTGSSRVTPD